MSRILTFLALILLVACSASPGDEPTSDDGSPSAAPSGGAAAGADGVLVIEEGTASGPGISVGDALGQMGGGPVLVNGSLLIDADGVMLLCDALAESFPPQCAGARLEVRGLDPTGHPDLQEANGVRWLDRTQLLGRVLPPGS